MVLDAQLPNDLADRAERRCWFCASDAALVLDWIEQAGQRFLGMDVAQKLDDGKWMLLLYPTLDLSYEADNVRAVEKGRAFISENDADGRMFEPVWEGR